ncbi:hypothetical protein [Phenylobacterium sp.]|uniref:hypothetical protein n=1 Tax=Phenylobacterium sp. TaxID=1871053 RepID=UPI00120C1924|nr:hypothetical protein [Phenylobacterium sp.]THD70285.1 MAG: hypothetical protein E8A12_03385 [Phenylobacterium sp.]
MDYSGRPEARPIRKTAELLLILACALTLAAPALAAPPAAGPPRAADGHLDLSGAWTNASVTKLTRPPGMGKLVLTPEEAKKLASSDPLVHRKAADAAPVDAAQGAPAVGDPGGYNAFWLDSGSAYGEVKGEYRTSWIVDPADGQLPFTEAGRKLVAQARQHTRLAETPSDPESFDPWDRCIIGSRGSGGPGMLNNIYNSNYQILQTPGAIVIVSEMIHDARTIPLFKDKATAQAAHGSPALQLWLGDPVAWWEGDTLVIETVNVNAEQGRAGPIFLTPKARITERLTRASAKQIYYEFTVEDPVYYTRPWRAEMSLNAIPGQVYEYACHEGNYALVDIMQGVRAAEAKGAAAPKSGGAN